MCVQHSFVHHTSVRIVREYNNIYNIISIIRIYIYLLPYDGMSHQTGLLRISISIYIIMHVDRHATSCTGHDRGKRRVIIRHNSSIYHDQKLCGFHSPSVGYIRFRFPARSKRYTRRPRGGGGGGGGSLRRDSYCCSCYCSILLSDSSFWRYCTRLAAAVRSAACAAKRRKPIAARATLGRRDTFPSHVRGITVVVVNTHTWCGYNTLLCTENRNKRHVSGGNYATTAS